MSAPPVGSPPRYPIESVDNALKLLLAFTERSTIGVSEASKLLGVAPSTAHRIMAMLVYWGFIQQHDRREEYAVGPAMIRLARSVLRSADLRGVARAPIQELVANVNETVHLAVLNGKNILFVDVVEGTQALRSGSRIGQTLPAHATAAGKAILAAMPEEQVRLLYSSSRLTRVTAETKTTLSTLLKDLTETRKRGYALNFGESEEHLHAVAAAVLAPDGHPVAAVTLAAPFYRLPRRKVPPLAKAVMSTTADISASLV